MTALVWAHLEGLLEFLATLTLGILIGYVWGWTDNPWREFAKSEEPKR